MVVNDLHTLRFETSLLFGIAAEGKMRSQPSPRVDNTVAGNQRGVRIAVKSISDSAGSSSVARPRRDLTVGRDPTVRYFTDCSVDFVVKGTITLRLHRSYPQHFHPYLSQAQLLSCS